MKDETLGQCFLQRLHGKLGHLGFTQGEHGEVFELGQFFESGVRDFRLDEVRGLRVEAGGGPMEGEGFVALTRTDGLFVWVLHLTDSEAFTAVALEGDEVVAVAQEYPARNVFRIPVDEPHKLRVDATWRPELFDT